MADHPLTLGELAYAPVGTALAPDGTVVSQPIHRENLVQRKTWDDKAAFDAQAEKLVQMFADNFEQYVPYIDEDVKAAAIG